MKWFMHSSAAGRDARLRKVKMKYGAEGLGLYWHCLEEVCSHVDPKLTFELESDSEILAHDLKIDTLKVEEMMRYMVSLGLFEMSGDVITCLKLARYLGDKNTRNDQLKAIIRQQKEDLSRTVPDSPRQSALEERRGEENRENQKTANRKRFAPPTLDELSDYISEKAYRVDPERFLAHYESNGWMVGKNKMRNWEAAVRGWHTRDKPTGKGSTRSTTFHDDLNDTSWA